MCENTRKFAEEKLSLLINLLNEYNIKYFADFGTLLGAVRENGIILWDDDIDLSVNLKDFENILDFLENNLALLNESDYITWKGYVNFSSEENPTNISLEFNTKDNINIKQFKINIGIIRIIDDKAIQAFNSVPKYHFTNREFKTQK